MEVTRRIEFDAGHRVIGHKNKCQYLHGHRYCLEVSYQSASLDELGMVVDFGKIKEVVKGWIDKNLDHTMILSKEDAKIGRTISQYTGQKVYYIENNPTAENIALHLKNDILPTLLDSKQYKLSGLRLYETPNCYVTV